MCYALKKNIWDIKKVEGTTKPFPTCHHGHSPMRKDLYLPVIRGKRGQELFALIIYFYLWLLLSDSVRTCFVVYPVYLTIWRTEAPSLRSHMIIRSCCSRAIFWRASTVAEPITTRSSLLSRRQALHHEPLTMNHSPLTLNQDCPEPRLPWTMNHSPLTMNQDCPEPRLPLTMNHEPKVT